MGRSTAILLGVFLLARPAHAGLYNTAEPPLTPAKELPKFMAQLAELRNLVPPDGFTMRSESAARKDYLDKITQLRDKAKSARLTVAEQANLGAYLIRVVRTRAGLPDYDEAIKVLQAAQDQDPRNFYVQANLACAYQLTGKLDVAERYLNNALAVVPAEYRQFERYHLHLLRSRSQEQLRIGQPPLDSLFIGRDGKPVRFISETGQWQVGQLAKDQVEKLPGQSVQQAMLIVQQLLLWFPDDARLVWLFGELANASGDLKTAYEAMDRAVYNYRLSTPELKQRRFMLQEAIAWRTVLDRTGDRTKQLHWVLQAIGRHAALSPQIDGSPQLLTEAARVPGPKGLDFNFGDGAAGPPRHWTAIFDEIDWRGWTVIGLGGVLIIGLLFLQLRKLVGRRRRIA